MIREIKNDKLYFGGCDTVELAEKYGTPLYVYSENDIVGKCSEIKEEFTDKYPRTRAAYAAKAFFTLAMADILNKEGMCVDVVSGGELYTALKAGFPVERIEFNGNNKSYDEIKLAVENHIGRIIIDGLQELPLIEQACRECNTTIKVLFRITPGVMSATHKYITTGGKDSKFGIPMDDDVILPQIKVAIDSKYVEFYGLHFHVGSQLFDNQSYLMALDVLLALVKKIKKAYGYDIKEINVGGGFGATYINEERKPYSYFIDPIMEKIEDYYNKAGIERPNVVIEPGRSIAAEAGIMLYTVGSIKEIPGIKTYMSVNGGMTDNIRPALYQAEYTGVIANKANEPKTDIVTVCGKCCESGDILINNLEIAHPEAGDTFAVFATGAYGYSMASNYNKNPIPGVALVKDGKSRMIVEHQTYDNMISRELK